MAKATKKQGRKRATPVETLPAKKSAAMPREEMVALIKLRNTYAGHTEKSDPKRIKIPSAEKVNDKELQRMLDEALVSDYGNDFDGKGIDDLPKALAKYMVETLALGEDEDDEPEETPKSKKSEKVAPVEDDDDDEDEDDDESDSEDEDEDEDDDESDDDDDEDSDDEDSDDEEDDEDEDDESDDDDESEDDEDGDSEDEDEDESDAVVAEPPVAKLSQVSTPKHLEMAITNLCNAFAQVIESREPLELYIDVRTPKAVTTKSAKAAPQETDDDADSESESAAPATERKSKKRGKASFEDLAYRTARKYLAEKLANDKTKQKYIAALKIAYPGKDKKRDLKTLSPRALNSALLTWVKAQAKKHEKTNKDADAGEFVKTLFTDARAKVKAAASA